MLDIHQRPSGKDVIHTNPYRGNNNNASPGRAYGTTEPQNPVRFLL